MEGLFYVHQLSEPLDDILEEDERSDVTPCSAPALHDVNSDEDNSNDVNYEDDVIYFDDVNFGDEIDVSAFEVHLVDEGGGFVAEEDDETKDDDIAQGRIHRFNE